MSRSDAVLCVLCARCSCSYASSVILRLWGQLYDACVDLVAKIVSLAMDTSRKTNMLLQGVAKEDRPHKP